MVNIPLRTILFLLPLFTILLCRTYYLPHLHLHQLIIMVVLQECSSSSPSAVHIIFFMLVYIFFRAASPAYLFSLTIGCGDRLMLTT